MAKSGQQTLEDLVSEIPGDLCERGAININSTVKLYYSVLIILYYIKCAGFFTNNNNKTS